MKTKHTRLPRVQERAHVSWERTFTAKTTRGGVNYYSFQLTGNPVYPRLVFHNLCASPTMRSSVFRVTAAASKRCRWVFQYNLRIVYIPRVRLVVEPSYSRAKSSCFAYGRICWDAAWKLFLSQLTFALLLKFATCT